MVPQLLTHLGVTHIALASHSGGDIYALNILLTFPHLLHPTTPYVAFFAPWVHPQHTDVHTMRAAELCPAPIIGRMVSVFRFINEKVVPIAETGGALVSGIRTCHRSNSSLISGLAPIPLHPGPPYQNHSRNSLKSSLDGTAGLDLDDPFVLEEMRQHILAFLFAESMDGIAADAQLFLKKPHHTVWCSPSVFWSDIDYAVTLLLKMIDENNGGENCRHWSIDSFHAGKDHMIGEKGRLWFDACWEPARSKSFNEDEPNKNSLDYNSEIVPDTEHRCRRPCSFLSAEH